MTSCSGVLAKMNSKKMKKIVIITLKTRQQQRGHEVIHELKKSITCTHTVAVLLFMVAVCWRDSIVIIPSFVLFRLRSTGGLGADDFVDAQNRAGCLGGEQDGPFLREKQIVELIQFDIAGLVGNVRRLRRGRLNLTDDEAHVGIVMMTDVELSENLRALHARVLGENLRNRFECFCEPLNGVLFDAGTCASVGR